MESARSYEVAKLGQNSGLFTCSSVFSGIPPLGKDRPFQFTESKIKVFF